MNNLDFFLILFCSLILVFLSLKVLISYKKISNYNFNKRKKLDRWGNSFKSHWGGISFLIGILFALLIISFSYDGYIFTKIFKILFLIILCCGFSLIDDIFLVSARLKLLFQIIISIFLIVFEFRIDFFNIQGLDLFLNIAFF